MFSSHCKKKVRGSNLSGPRGCRNMKVRRPRILKAKQNWIINTERDARVFSDKTRLSKGLQFILAWRELNRGTLPSKCDQRRAWGSC